MRGGYVLERPLFELRGVVSILLGRVPRESWTCGPTSHELGERDGGFRCDGGPSMFRRRGSGLACELLQGIFLAFLPAEWARRW